MALQLLHGGKDHQNIAGGRNRWRDIRRRKQENGNWNYFVFTGMKIVLLQIIITTSEDQQSCGALENFKTETVESVKLQLTS